MSTTPSSEGKSEEVSEESTEVTEIEPTKIFINHVDTYQGQAIVAALPTTRDKNNTPFFEISGTIQGCDMPGFEELDNKITSIVRPSDSFFMTKMLENEIIVYDIGSDSSQIDEAEMVLDALEKFCNSIKGDESKRDLVKYFILISSPLTWAKTPPIDEESDVLIEEHYRKRKHHHCYVRHKCLEREVTNFQKRCKPHVRTVVLCPGITYGGPNDVLHYMFKLAFYNRDIIPLFRPGNNYVPLLYIKDFGRMVKQIIENFPERNIRYILAVQPRLIHMKTLVRNIVFNVAGNVTKIKLVNPEEVMKTHEELISARVFHAITMNIKMAPTYFEDFDFRFEDNYEDFGTVLAEEFRRTRNLLPIRIIIDGPPMVGKTTLAKCIANHYYLHYYETDKIIETVIKDLLKEIEETKEFLDLLEEEMNNAHDQDANDQDVQDDVMDMEDRLKELLLEWMTELEEINEFVEEQKEKATEPKMLTEEHEEPTDDFEYKKRCILKVITSKACNENQGYVLDGFPFEYSKAAEIFPTVNLDGEEGEEEGAGDSTPLKPDYVILLDAPDDLLCKRAMALPEEIACATKNTEDEFLKRLEEYRERNEEDKALQTFFYDIDVIPMTFCIKESTKCDEIFEKVQDEIGAPHIYPVSKAEREAMELWKQQMQIKHEMEMARIREEAIAREREQREANLQKWTKEFERLKCKEQEYIEAKTLPLRQYLAKFVLPPLTQGLIKVAEIKPEDPVDFLAEHLFEYNPHGHVLDPSYPEKMKKLLLEEGDEDIAATLDMMAENEGAFSVACSRKNETKEKPFESSSSTSSSTVLSDKKYKEVRVSNLVKALRGLQGHKSEECNN